MASKRKRSNMGAATATATQQPHMALGANIDFTRRAPLDSTSPSASASAAASASASAAAAASASASASITPASSTATSGPIVDPYEGVEVGYRHSICKKCKKGEFTPPEPLLARRLVIDDITENKKYRPKKHHLCALRVTRMLLKKMKSNQPCWYSHDDGARRIQFQQFQKYFVIAEELYIKWNGMAARTYKDHMMWRRRKCIENPLIAAKDQLWLSVWSQEEFQELSDQMKVNRSKNPCGNTQHWLGRKGLEARCDEFIGKYGVPPNIVQQCEIQFMKKVTTLVDGEDGIPVEEETILFVNPHAEAEMAGIVQDITSLSMPDPTQPDAPATPPTKREQMKIVAKHFGIGKKGAVIGLGASAAEVVPRSSGRKSRTSTLEVRHRELEEQLSSVAREKDSFQQQLQDQARQMAVMQKALDILMAARTETSPASDT